MSTNSDGSSSDAPVVGIIMGSKSDWPTMKHAAEILDDFGIRYEARVVSAHRTPELMVEYAKQACLLYTSPSPRDKRQSRMPSSA